MSSIVSFTLGIVEYVRDRKTEGWIFAGIAFLFLLVACDAAWQDEHRNSEVLIAEKSLAVQGENFWKEQSYQKDAALRSRDQLLAQNYSALIGAQTTGNETQESLTHLSEKILDIGKPPVQKTTPVFLEKIDMGGGTLKSKIILLTNRLVSPVDMEVTCDRIVSSVDVYPLPKTPHFAQMFFLTQNSWEARVNNPPWTPEVPLMVETIYQGSVDEKVGMVCNYSLR